MPYWLHFKETSKETLTWIAAWISNHMPNKMWDGITYAFPNLQQVDYCSLGMDDKLHVTLYDGCNYLSMQVLKSIHVGKSDPDHNSITVTPVWQYILKGLLEAW